MTRLTDRRTTLRPAIKKIVRRLVEQLQPETIILYGSYAYGAPRETSDIDLLIVKDLPGSFFSRMRRVTDVVGDLAQGTRVEARIYDPEHLLQRLRAGDHFVQEVIDRGELLYGKSWREERESIVADELAYAREWLDLAEEDLRWVQIGFREQNPGRAGYYLQQALEKFFKAYLIAKGWRLQRTHELKDLLNEARRYDPSLGDFDQLGETVTEWHMADRYVDTGKSPPIEEEARDGAAAAQPLIDKLRAL